MKAEFHPAASEEIVETTAFYENEVSGLGDRFISEVEQILELLREQPQIGQQIEKEFRRIVLARFPYSLIYIVSSQRKSGWWQWPINADDQVIGEKELAAKAFIGPTSVRSSGGR